MTKRSTFLFSICVRSLLVSLLMPTAVLAAQFTYTRDIISESAPGATTTSHLFEFGLSTTVPLGGSISITPEGANGNYFNVSPLLDFSHIDLAVATGSGDFIDRPLAAVASGVADGVSVTSGASGNVIITLGDTTSGAIQSGSRVQVRIGSAATFGGVGSETIEHPGSVGSYRIRVRTTNGALGAGTPLDEGTAMIALVNPVTVGPIDNTDVIPPIRTNGMPSGQLLGSTPAVQISLNTDKNSVCRVMTTPGVLYDAMTATMTSATNGLLHYMTVNGLTPNTSYSYYIRCMNTSKYFNSDDYPILFNLGDPVYAGSNATNSGVVIVPGSTGNVNAPQGASSFSGPGPAGGPYLAQGAVTIDGDTFPLARIVYLRDGKVVREDAADSNGHFTVRFDSLDRGTYAWGVYAKDPKEKVSSTYTSTVYLIGNTNNIIAPVYLSPTVISTSTVGVGEDVLIEGYAIPKKDIRVVINKMGDVLNSKILTATTTSSAEGKYRITMPTAQLAKGTYEVKAQAVINSKEASIFSPVFYLGIGESPRVDFALRADLNKDKKVNLVDFSILLFNWKTSDPVADINQDGTVSLTDFSIMLANWTG